MFLISAKMFDSRSSDLRYTFPAKKYVSFVDTLCTRKSNIFIERLLINKQSVNITIGEFSEVVFHYHHVSYYIHGWIMKTKIRLLLCPKPEVHEYICQCLHDFCRPTGAYIIE